MYVDRPVLGILLMLGFCVLAPVGDAIAKILGAVLPVYTLVLVRFGIQAVLLVPVVRARGGSLRLRSRVALLAWLRAGLHIAGIGAMFTALQHLPLADAIAIAFVMPFIMLLLGWTILGESVGWRRLGACAVGFCGTLMVIQPAFESVGWPALLPLVVAVVFSFFMLTTRTIAREVDPITLQAINGIMAIVILLPLGGLLWLIGVELWPRAALSPASWMMLVAIGLIGTFAHLLMTWSLRFAPSATVAPMQYLEIPMATLIGWLVFGDLPNGLAAIGIAVTIAAGVYVIYREQAMARHLAKPGPSAQADPLAAPPKAPAPRPQA